ncbi:MAG: putative camp-dependent protein kinase 10 [Streblomastix strix]|uniref:non-specific serine/threonine protein kinase n=1 Tax=Streblomastix strix TaxID=222440 RepID=A0A5J4UXT9_9EUKA|nr:MAG: putative camp-dependent protein kinase 10 [Streblomastix strix]
MASYEVLTDFSNPDTTKYLNVKKGDRITKINEPEPGWSMCFIEGRNGYVPTSYIKPVTDTTPLSQIPQPLPKRSIVAPPTMGWMQEDQYHKYKMIRKLFGGAQGKTFLVERKETNKLFVLKKVDYLDADDIQKANREVEQMFNLASPFTVLLVCVFPHDDVELCLVMEYCEKGDLRKVMAQLQQLPEEERLMRVWEILAQIFLAVDHLHSHDVIHRDIKPENIFVMADGSVRVGDFGLAKNVENRDYATAVGTKVYQAPEVFEQQKHENNIIIIYG